ncbi:MAG: aspartate aminotransferase family protein, partial [Burkholderiales bacterium]|nr:aspartate aminotransferase family protein [Burkholderiales bacterium]
MSRILHRNPGAPPPLAASARGITITDASGRTYIDASGGAAVSCLGHGHPEVVAAMRDQLERLEYAHTGFFSTEAAEALAEMLVADAPAGIGAAFFVSGGSEAVESAMKLARQYYVEIGEPDRSVFIARRQSYHGNTLGALALGGNEARRRQFAPLLIDVARVSACFEYRGREPAESAEQYSERLARELEDTILRLGPQRVIAFCAETVVGATAGAVPPTPGYFRRVREICDRHGILLLCDEIMCGLGRTGSLHAIEQEDVAPDLMALAKGLGGGYQPVGAVLASAKIVDALRKGSGAFQHSHTYVGHPVAAAAALAVQKILRRDRLVDAVRARGARLRRLLQERFGDHPHVGDIRGRGLLLALELVKDRATKEPFDPALKLHARVKAEAMRQGLLVYPMGGT